MQDLSMLIQQLDAPSKYRRYEACELLRAAPSLTLTALAALQQHAERDPERWVARAAQRALAAHDPSGAARPGWAMHTPEPLPGRLLLLAGAVAWITYSLAVMCLASLLFAGGMATYGSSLGGGSFWLAAIAGVAAVRMTWQRSRTLKTASLAAALAGGAVGLGTALLDGLL